MIEDLKALLMHKEVIGVTEDKQGKIFVHFDDCVIEMINNVHLVIERGTREEILNDNTNQT